jgi:hypothetical protein
MSTGNPVNPFAAAAEALKSGKDIEQAVYGQAGSTPTENNVPASEEKPEVQVEAAGDTAPVEVKVEAVDEASPMEQAKAEDQGQAKKEAAKPELDKVKQYERGMRKFQAERDRIAKEAEIAKKELSELKNHWSKLEAGFSESGIAGVINAIAGKQDAYKEFLEAEIARRNEYERATPSQRTAMEAEEKRLAAEKRAAQLEQKFKDLENSVTAKSQEAEQKALQSVVNPVFEKYRFSGKLGDAEAEYYQDKALWQLALDNLNELPEEKITPEAIESEFRKVSSTLRKVITKQADSKAKKVVESKKAHAQEAAATKAMSGMSNSSTADEFRKQVRSGNLSDALRQVMMGKIRLS